MEMRSQLPLRTGILACLFLVQLAWWAFVIVRDADRIFEARSQALAWELQAAQAEFADVENEEDREALWAARASAYPHLSFARSTGIQIAAPAVRKLNEQRSGASLMVASESALFAILVLLGVGLLVRTWKREKFLVLQQSNFLHAVTHELRSPLQSLRLAVETLQRKPSADRVERYTPDMLADLDRLGALVDNLLATGRLEAEAFRAQSEVVNLSALVEQELLAIRQRQQLSESLFQLDLPADVEARLDPSTLEPILRNLVDNALKYGGEQPIHIEVGQDGSEALLAVTDSGRGLAAEERLRVFDRFWRAGDEQTRTAPGTGLGLFLVRALVQAQEGRIEVLSEGLGKGARFEVRFPLH